MILIHQHHHRCSSILKSVIDFWKEKRGGCYHSNTLLTGARGEWLRGWRSCYVSGRQYSTHRSSTVSYENQPLCSSTHTKPAFCLHAVIHMYTDTHSCMHMRNPETHLCWRTYTPDAEIKNTVHACMLQTHPYVRTHTPVDAKKHARTHSHAHMLPFWGEATAESHSAYSHFTAVRLTAFHATDSLNTLFSL